LAPSGQPQNHDGIVAFYLVRRVVVARSDSDELPAVHFVCDQAPIHCANTDLSLQQQRACLRIQCKEIALRVCRQQEPSGGYDKARDRTSLKFGRLAVPSMTSLLRRR
jgi:hypothetical protein